MNQVTLIKVYWDDGNSDLSGGHCFMNSHTLSKANDPITIDYINKRDGNVPNVSEMGDTGLQDGVDIYFTLSSFTIHQYSNT